MKSIFLIKQTSAITILSFLCMVGCVNNTKSKSTKAKINSSNVVTDTLISTHKPTYQHIALAKIRDNIWDKYVTAMHNNIANTHEEPGNILFTLFQPEDGSHQVAFIERYKNRAAFMQHLKAPYLPEEVNKESVLGKMEIRELKEVKEIPAVEPENSDSIVTPRNVMVFFHVKPEKRQEFINAVKELTPHSRKAEGNIRFNIFQQTDNENKFVLLESWESISAHSAHLVKNYSVDFDKAVKGFFVTDPMENRLLLKDISI